MAYQCPECKLLFSTLPECCPECAGAVTADQRLDRYYVADGYRKYTGQLRPAAPVVPVTPKPPVAKTVPVTSEPPVAKTVPVTSEPPVAKSMPRPKIQDDDTLAALRDAYYRQHGNHDPEPPQPSAPGSSFFDDPTPPPQVTPLPEEPEPVPPEPPKPDPPPVSVNSGSFFNDPGPAPYVPDLLEDPDPEPTPPIEPEPTPPLRPEPLPRQRTPRGTGGYGFWNALAGIRWGCVFRVLLVLLVVGIIAALWANRAAIFDGILSIISALLPTALLVGGVIYLLRALIRGR